MFNYNIATLVCAHDTTILTNREPSELVKGHLLCSPGKDVDYNIRENDRLKIIFRCM